MIMTSYKLATILICFVLFQPTTEIVTVIASDNIAHCTDLNHYELPSPVIGGIAAKLEPSGEETLMKKIHRFAGIGLMLTIMLPVDVEAAPINMPQNPAQISNSDGLIIKATTTSPSRVRVRRHRGHRVPRQMAHRRKRSIEHAIPRERTLTHAPQ